MQFQKLILILSLVTLISCESNKGFEPPELINSQIHESSKIHSFRATMISEQNPIIIGKFNQNKKIDINPKNRYNLYSKDYRSGNHSDKKTNDSINSNGFELIIDYETTVAYNPYSNSNLFEYYPIYIYNPTNQDKLFFGKDLNGFGIQEAIDKSNNQTWRPIESKTIIGCENGYWTLIVHPHEFVILLMKKYTADDETQIRVRLKIGKNKYISKPFIGKIDPRQFSIKDKSTIREFLQKSNGKAAEQLFYGASPNEKEWR